MVSKKQKEKNIKDLEYNHLLNKQSISLVLIGTAIISIILTDKLPSTFNVTKTEILVLLFGIGVGILLYFGKKLEKKANEIENI